MKKITLFFVGVLCTLNVVKAQGITVFDFDGATPTFSSYSSTFVSVANPVSDEVNASANVGKFTHNAMWSDISIDLTATPIDSRYCTSFQFKVYSPAEGLLIVGCKDAADTILSEYNSAQSVTTGWTIITQDIDVTQPITKIYISFKVNTAPVGDATDNIYLDDLTFITKANATLYTENFTADLAWDAAPTVTPSTKAGKWKGGIDLETVDDASITLEQQWAPHDRVLKLTSTDAAVTIPNINVAGFDNLKLIFDNKWPWSTEENDIFYGLSDVDKLPVIEIKSGSGSWTPLTTNAFTQDWTTETIALPSVDDSQPLSLRLSKNSNVSFVIDNLRITGQDITLGTESNLLKEKAIVFYPNPFVEDFKVEAIKSQEPIRVTIFDIMGREVKVKESISAPKLSMGSSLKAGLYVVKVEGLNSNLSKSFKILKK